MQITARTVVTTINDMNILFHFPAEGFNSCKHCVVLCPVSVSQINENNSIMILIIKLSLLCKKETVMYAFYIHFDFDFVLIDIFRTATNING